jgi:mannose-6-phosphate isomerase-like protein (cupin superfamily)
MRSGRIRWTVEGKSRDAEAGGTIVTPARVEHPFEVLDGNPAQVVCLICPPAAPDA